MRHALCSMRITMLDTNYLKNILFIDIETVSCEESYDQVDDRLKGLWDKKAQYINLPELSNKEKFYEKAGIYAEFGKIITIGIGYFSKNLPSGIPPDKPFGGSEAIPQGESAELTFRVKAIASHNEKDVLADFKRLLEDKFDASKLLLCAHNGKEFDYPYICRRMLVHQIDLPKTLDISGKKPWEVQHLDTMQMWKFGDHKHYTSLDLLAALFGIPTSKDGIDGSMVNHVYYKEKDLDKIAEYCKRDVVVTAQLFLRLNNHPVIDEGNIHLL